jgi:hypothetical protein
MALGFYDPEPLPLPHPPISLPVLLIVERALCAAWSLLRTSPRPGFDLRTAQEDVITNELCEALYDRIFPSGIVEGFDAQLFSSVHREPKLRNYDYRHLDKMPDLLVKLIGRPGGIMHSQDGLFIECKPVDLKHNVLSHYCGKGLIRFTRGDYAWAMTNAMMIGYAASPYNVLPKLSEALTVPPPGITTILLPEPCTNSVATSISEAVYLSKHVRDFKYVGTNQLVQPITIRHLWLRRD